MGIHLTTSTSEVVKQVRDVCTRLQESRVRILPKLPVLHAADTAPGIKCYSHLINESVISKLKTQGDIEELLLSVVKVASTS